MKKKIGILPLIIFNQNMATYVVGTQKARLNETFLLSTQSIKAKGQHIFFKTLRPGQVSFIYLAPAVRITYAEDRMK